MRKEYKSLQVFKNPYLEKLTHVHPLTPLVVWAPIAGWLIWRAFAVHQLGLYEVFSIGMAGFFLWTLVEYGLHRFIFHFESDHPWGQRLHFLLHGLHHDDPIDPTRLVMPPVMSVFLAFILFNTFRYFMGPVWVEPFFAFFVIGYLAYDYIHFCVHHFRPRTPIGKFLKNSHMIHHYVDQNSRWGVSSPFWDYIFGTLGEAKEKKAKKSEAATS
jgi:sterol desaturase/sphingolipid hydroxylase (fatty acid hydroxylase superfamily)